MRQSTLVILFMYLFSFTNENLSLVLIAVSTLDFSLMDDALQYTIYFVGK